MDTTYFYFEINGFHHEKNVFQELIEEIKDTSSSTPKICNLKIRGEKNRKS